MVVVRPLEERDREWARESLIAEWGSARVVSTSGLHDASTLPGFVAERQGQPVGLVTYRIADGECEVVTLHSTRPGAGAGTALLEAVRGVAVSEGCRRLWLITTNDNTPALRFYQRRGWDLVALHRGVLAEWRQRKPEIPERGLDGIPLLHALELQLPL